MTTSHNVKALVERLRQPWDGSAGCREKRDEEREEAASKLEALAEENERLRRERDEAQTSKRNSERWLGEEIARVTQVAVLASTKGASDE